MTTKANDPNKTPKHCPECMKKGVKKKVKAFYINLDNEVRTLNELITVFRIPKGVFLFQGVNMCEDVLCPWPFNVTPASEVLVKMK